MRKGPQVMAPFTCGNVAILIKIAQRATSNGAIYLRQCRNFDKDLRQGPQVFAPFTCGNVGILIKICAKGRK
jgi:hypothetical protein